MKKQNFFGKSLALIMALAMLLAMVPMTVLAEEPTPTAVSTKFQIPDYVLMDDDVNVPEFGFYLKLEPGEPDPDAIPVVYAGIIDEYGIKWEITNVIRDAAVSTTPDSVVTSLEPGQGYAVSNNNFGLDFSSLTFENAGIYRYVLTHKSHRGFDNLGIVCDPNPVRCLDVEVGEDLKIKNIILHATDKPDSAKSGGFINEYVTQTVTIAKTVSGNQADLTEEFDFELTIPAVNKKGVNIDASGVKVATTKNPTVTSTTSATKIYLGDGDSIKIKIPASIDYTVTELGATDYTTTITAEGSTVDAATKTASGTMADANRSITYNNNKEGVVPTGVLLDVWPYLLMVAVAGVALILMMGNKRKHAMR